MPLVASMLLELLAPLVPPLHLRWLDPGPVPGNLPVQVQGEVVVHYSLPRPSQEQ